MYFRGTPNRHAPSAHCKIGVPSTYSPIPTHPPGVITSVSRGKHPTGPRMHLYSTSNGAMCIAVPVQLALYVTTLLIPPPPPSAAHDTARHRTSPPTAPDGRLPQPSPQMPSVSRAADNTNADPPQPEQPQLQSQTPIPQPQRSALSPQHENRSVSARGAPAQFRAGRGRRRRAPHRRGRRAQAARVWRDSSFASRASAFACVRPRSALTSSAILRALV